MRSSVLFPEGKALYSQQQCAFPRRNEFLLMAYEKVRWQWRCWGAVMGRRDISEVSGTEEHLDNARAYDVPGTRV